MDNNLMIINQITDYSRRGTGFITEEGLQKYSEMLSNEKKIKLDILDIIEYVNTEKTI